MLWSAVYKWAFWPVLIVTAFFAWRRGGPPERAGAVMFVAAATIELIARSIEQAPWLHFDWVFAAIDIALCIGLIVLVFRFGRIWTILASSLQVLTVIGHVARFLYPELSPLAYAILAGSSGYPATLALLIGANTAQRSTH